ncbi:MAG TPA: uroporphyrinogen decarboxylase family protein [Armatimonadota bacterium]|nr:uroporphyrinogen decarboxylase family protein [Armatimonadota bacterium]
MRWHREEYLELMTFGRVERQMFVELFGPLANLETEWAAQGVGADEIGMVAFDWDYVPVVGCGGNTDMRGGRQPVAIEDTAEYCITTDAIGRTMKLCKGYATIPLPLDYPVKDMDDWLRLKPHYQFHEDRIDWEQVAAARAAQAHGALVLAGVPGGFDLPRQLMGEEGASLCYYDNPELMQDILQTVAEAAFQVLDRISDHVLIDNLCVHEDMAGKSGSLIGPATILAFIKPYYRRIWDMLSAKGTRLFSQDSDGNMCSVIDAFLECGVNVMFPAEPAAGMDIVALRKHYGNRLAFKGGIDKHVLRLGHDDIRKELEYKMQPLMQQGGVVFGLDHRITNGTPIENYRFYVEYGRELLGLPPRDATHKGWQRMAF